MTDNNATLPDQIGIVEQAWTDAAMSVAPNVKGLHNFLEKRLRALNKQGNVDERSLLGIIEDVSHMALSSGSAETARLLSRRMQRAVYEYLLALDALSPAEHLYQSPSTPSPPPHAEGARMDAADDAPEQPDTVAPSDMSVQTLKDENENDESPASLTAVDAAATSTVADTASPTSAEESQPPGPFIAPLEGFHLADPTLVVGTHVFPSTENGTDTTLETQPSAEDQAQPADDHLQNATEEPSPVVEIPQESTADVSPKEAIPDTAAAVESEPAITDIERARAELDRLFAKKHFDEVGSVLQLLAQDVGDQEVSHLALDTGDRCRAAGKHMAATNCYLAAARADPLFDQPLMRLVEVAIDDHDPELAITYLERVAKVARLRGDNDTALRIYRRMVAVAPYREDILEMLVRAQDTGSFD